ncbi:MAG: 8-oxo-dGTP diphosphatase [Candidatus Micrarchaeota archaeon]|nr:8-oxo-dGTP diphosphatase [Candidatus Micrarchaeota archaeon]
MIVEASICHILRGDELLLIKANRGVSKGKWNGVGGKLENGESAEACAIRETFEETGLVVKNLLHHGKINFFMDGKSELTYIVHLFSSRDYSGAQKSTDEGELAWFKQAEIPYTLMWEDDIYWLSLLLAGKRLECDFYYDRENERVIRYSIRES